jgi:hypothetical protein
MDVMVGTDTMALADIHVIGGPDGSCGEFQSVSQPAMVPRSCAWVVSISLAISSTPGVVL